MFNGEWFVKYFVVQQNEMLFAWFAEYFKFF